MQLPLQVTFRHIDGSPALEARIRELAQRLARFSANIVGCHVTIESPHRHHRQGNVFDVKIDVTVPGKAISIRHAHPQDRAHEDPYVALRDAFRAATRKLQDYERKRRQDVKTHVGPAQGRICEIDVERDFGRIETDDGRLVYFHRNSVLGYPFERLTTGAEVRFAEEPGDRGPQASTVHVIS